MQVGELEVVPLSDGVCLMPPEYFPNADWSEHQALFGPDGTMHLPIGCFLVRTGDQTVLIDAGLGPRDLGWLVVGDLPASRAEHVTSPADIDVVVCTHLHLDHAGWLVENDSAYFPNASVRFGVGDWEAWVTNANPKDRIREAMLLLDEQQRLDPIDGDDVSIAPGITARAAPGHTMGHHVLVLSSGVDRLLLLGDAVTCPVQLEEEDWQAMSDMDPALSRRTRDALWAELEGTSTRFTAAHFPDLEFGRALRGAGKRHFR